MRKIAVLLSTYNGEKWLKELIDSVRIQENVSIRIVIRDDNSEDDSLEIVKRELSDFDVEFCSHIDSNIGAAESYWHLMQHLNDTDYYIAFCDQDDIWLASKLSAAVDALSQYENIPAIYASSIYLNNTNRTWPNYSPIISFENSLVQNPLIGCTLVMNQEFLRIVQNSKVPKGIMHDAWIYSIAACRARIYYDYKPKIVYRIHANNDTGITLLSIKNLRGLLSSLFKLPSYYLTLISKWQNLVCSELICDEHRILTNKLLVGLSHHNLFRIKYICQVKIRHTRRIHNVLYFLLYILMPKKV